MGRGSWLALALVAMALVACGGPDLEGDPVRIGGEGAIDPTEAVDFESAREALTDPNAAVTLPQGSPVADLSDAAVVVDDGSQSVVVQGVSDTPAGDAITSVGTFYQEDGSTQTVTMFTLTDVDLGDVFQGVEASVPASNVFVTFGGPGGPIPLSPVASDQLSGALPSTEPGSTTYTVVLDPEQVDGLTEAMDAAGVSGPPVFEAIVPGEPFTLGITSIALQTPIGTDGEELIEDWITSQPPTLAISVGSGHDYYVETVVDMELGGETLTFAQRAESGEDAPFRLVSAWNSPFGVPWLTPDTGTLTLGEQSVSVEARVRLDDREMTARFDLGRDGTGFVSARPDESLSLEQAVSLFAAATGIPAFDIPQAPALRDLELSGRLGDGEPHFALSAGTTVGALDADVAIAPAETTDGTELLLTQLSLGSVSLADIVTATAGTPAGDLSFPGASLLIVDTGGADEVIVDASTIPIPDIAGSGPYAIPAGVAFNAELPLANLDAGFREAFGIGSSGTVLFEGSVGATLGSMSSSAPTLSLRASLPDALFPDPPGPLVVSDEGLVLVIDHGERGTALEVRTAAVAEVDDTRFQVDLYARRTADGVVMFRGELAEPWAAPLGIDWLTMSEITLTAQSGSDAGVTFHAAADTRLDLSGTVDLALRADAASFTATLDGTVGIGAIFDLIAEEIGAEVFPALDVADRFTVGDLVLSVSTGADPTFGVRGTTSVDVGDRTLAATLTMVSVNEDGRSRYAMGIEPEGGIGLSDLSEQLPPGLEDVALDQVSFIVSNTDFRFDRVELSDVEQTFYETVFGSIDPDARVSRGLNVVATMGMPGALEPVATALWMDTSRPFVVQGTVPGSVIGMGGPTTFGLTGLLPQITPPPGAAPDWLHSGRLLLGMGAGSASLGGRLRINVPNEEDPSGVEQLTFGIETELDLLDQSIELIGFLEADGWEQPFGIEWLTLNQVAALIGFTATPPAVTLGFSGDAVIVEKDFQTALVVGFTPIPVPLGTRFATESGLTLNDLISLSALLDPDGEGISTDSLPNLGLSFVELAYGAKDYPDLGIERGFVVAGDLYLDASSDPGNPEALCAERKDNGCIASVRVRVVPEGIEARGEIVGFEAGPIIWEDGIIDFVLTPFEQHLYVDGGATIADAITGHVTLDVGATEMYARGAVELFGFEAELEAEGGVDLSGPEFAMQATLRSDFSEYVVDQTIPVIVALSDRLDEVISIWQDLEERPATGFARLEDLMVEEGLPIPFWMTATADTIDAINSAIDTAESLGVSFFTPDDVVVAALNGVTIFPGTPAVRGVWVNLGFTGFCRPAIGGESTNCTIIPAIGEIRVPGACQTFAEVACTARENAEADLRNYLAHTNGLTVEPGQLDEYLPTIRARLSDALSSAIPLEVSCASVAGSLNGLFGSATLETAMVVNVLGDVEHYSLAWDFADGPGSAARLVTAMVNGTQSSDLCMDEQDPAPVLGEPVVDESLDEVEEAPAAAVVTQTVEQVSEAAEETARIEAERAEEEGETVVTLPPTTTTTTTAPPTSITEPTIVAGEEGSDGAGRSVAMVGLIISLLAAAGGGVWWWMTQGKDPEVE